MHKNLFRNILLAVLGTILFVFVLINMKGITGFIGKIVSVFRPLIIGAALAFILNKPKGRIEKLYTKLFDKIRKEKLIPNKSKVITTTPTSSVPEVRAVKGAKILSIVTVYLLFFAIIFTIIGFVLPQLAESINFFINSFEGYYTDFTRFFTNFTEKYDISFIITWIEDYDIINKFYKWFYSLADYIPELLSKTLGITTNIVSGLIDVFIGLIFSIYIISGKERLKKQFRVILKHFCSEQVYKNVAGLYRLTSDTFSNFIGGQLTEACIVGVLCFIGMSLFGWEYSLLISVIIGLTNLIPMFGPIIGTIPCGLILLLVNPIHALWFVLFVIILQQLESNLIYPRVVGASVGLPPIYTLAAIIIGGGLFGVLGMILSLPIMSIAYTIIKYIVIPPLSKDLMNSKKRF